MRRRLLVGGLQDVLAVAGAMAIGYGLWLMYEPLAWMWAGGALLLVSYGWQNETRDS